MNGWTAYVADCPHELPRSKFRDVFVFHGDTRVAGHLCLLQADALELAAIINAPATVGGDDLHDMHPQPGDPTLQLPAGVNGWTIHPIAPQVYCGTCGHLLRWSGDCQQCAVTP